MTAQLDAIEGGEVCAGGRAAQVNFRAMAIRRVATLLDASLAVGPEFAPLTVQLSGLAQAIVQRLQHLLVTLIEHERSQEHIVEELAKNQERVLELPPFNYLEPREIASARQGAEKLRAKLGEEAREETRQWLKTLGEEKLTIAELFTEYEHLLSKLGIAAEHARVAPRLADLFAFMQEPPSTPVVLIITPMEVKPPAKRVP